jgi:2-polyprenyl-3-methyl-5-hydroxy-6-metoxy-1,4-benzoquinol methylase
MSVYSDNKYRKDAPNDAWYKIFGFIKPNSTILDIGCSSGSLGAALKKEKKVHVIGIDLDKADVELAKQNLDEAHVGNVETDDLSKFGTFDYVVMADVLEHLLDPVSTLKKVKKLLKPNGAFVFSIPNMANATTRIELLKGNFTYKDFGLLDRTHLHFYDRAEVNRIFNEAGMIVEKMDCTLRVIPDNILEQELAKIGIDLTPKFKKHLSDTDAATYQFIGIARPGKTPNKMKAISTTELDVISIEMERLNAAHREDISMHQKIIKRLESEVSRLDTELSAILNSRSWKAVKRVHKVKSLIPKRRS